MFGSFIFSMLGSHWGEGFFDLGILFLFLGAFGIVVGIMFAPLGEAVETLWRRATGGSPSDGDSGGGDEPGDDGGDIGIGDIGGGGD